MRTRHMKWLGSAALVAGLVACSSMKVQTDADPQANLTAYKRFSFARVEGAEAAQKLDGLMAKRVEDAITAELTKKGLVLDSSGANADVFVVYHAGKEDKVEVYNNAGYSYGRWGGAYYGGGTSVSQYTEGSLTVDLYDGKRKEMVWRGTASDTVNNRDDAARKIPVVVAKMFEKFPKA
jgi:hypothetical protein